MTAAGLAFYGLAALVLGTTLAAVTRRSPVHAVVWLMASLVGTAGLFAVLGAPVLAALQVVLYAGGILVLLLFVVLGFHAHAGRHGEGPVRGALRWRRWGLGAALGGGGFLAAALVLADPGARAPLAARSVAAREVGTLLFERYPLAVEAVSLLLFVALAGALYLGRAPAGAGEEAP